MREQFILALDQGTTSSRAILFDGEANPLYTSQQEFNQIFPRSGWVEHDPHELWGSQMNVMDDVISQAQITPDKITAIGITNQRETTLLWDRETGDPIYNAIVWQDTRTSGYCEEIKQTALKDQVHEKTGLVVDSYFSATKIKWILDNIEGAKEKAESGSLAFGTVDTWLIWKLTNGEVHATDYTNASRTMVYNIKNLQWDEELLKALDIPMLILPEVKPSSGTFGYFNYKGTKIPISGVAGDQQAALFGQQCFTPGTAKNTYGTGCFMLMNTGKEPYISENGLVTTLACDINGEVVYALEGSIFIAGAAVQWLRDSLKIIESANETEQIAASLSSENNVYVVPAFAGLGAPYWDMQARGAIFGLTRDTGREHIVKSTLESLAYQTRDVLEAMEKDSEIEMKSLKVDGGAVANNYLLQFQSDILGKDVIRPKNIETTALGAAYLAGLACGLWDAHSLSKTQDIDMTFTPSIDEQARENLYKGWQNAVQCTMKWTNNISR